jgi:MoaA/NifB/PqqE/SkfB family radical SAM enzyme
MWKEFISPLNPFNPVKAVAHQERIKAAMNWLEGKSDALPPPTTLTIDPTNVCQVNCWWCKNKDYRGQNSISISDQRLLTIPSFLRDWGVSAVVVSGGEPLLHPKIAEFLDELHDNKIQVGLKTNGVALGKQTIRDAVLRDCSWVGFSVDAASADSYLRVKKTSPQSFGKVVENVTWLAKNRNGTGRPRLTMKFLIHPATFRDGFAFCDLSKSIGADEVVFRPVSLPHMVFSRGVKRTAQFFLREGRLAFEDDKFKIYGLVSKFEREWDRAIRFKTCYASPLAGVMAADGKFYICSDRRGDMSAALGNWFPYEDFLSLWGSEQHRELIKSIRPESCPKCSLSGVNEMAEQCFPTDTMFLDFI